MSSEPRMIVQILDVSNYVFSVHAAATFTATAILLALGLLVLVHERASRVSRLFALVTFTVSVWLFAFSWMYSTTSESVAYWWAKAAYLCVPSIGPAIYHFTAVALQIYPRCKKFVWIGWILSALFTTIIMTTDALIAGLYRYWWGYYPQYGWLSIPFLTFFFGTMIASLRDYWVEYQASGPGTRKRRIKTFMIAIFFAYLATIDYLPKFGVPIYPFGYLPVLGWLGLVAVAIWRHQFVDITPAFAAEQITNTMTEALLVLDHDGMVRLANRAACALFGYAEADLLGKPISAVSREFYPLDKRNILFQTGTCPRYETNYRDGQGRSLSLEVSASVIRDRLGQPAAVVCVARDITERKQAEQAIRSSEERFGSVAQSANDAIISADSRGNIVYWNRGARVMFGYEEGEVLGKPLTTLMSERYRDVHQRGLERARTTGASKLIGKTIELHGLKKDGQEFPIELSLATWKTDDETFYSGIIRDVTERKQAEEERTRLASFPELNPQPVIESTFDGTITYINPAAKTMFPDLAILGIRHPILQNLPVVVDTLEREGSGSLLREITLADSIWEQQINCDSVGKLVRIYAVDITERRQLEEQLRQSQKMDAIGQLAGGVAHDFNNLLTVISGNSQLALRRLPAEHPQRRNIEQIHHAGQRAAALTHQLLAFSRKQILQPTVLDLNAVAYNLTPMLRRLIGEHIELSVTLRPDAGLVKADAGQIEQVIMNLCVNARDAMPQGGRLTLALANVRIDRGDAVLPAEVTPGEYVMLAVSDTGVGMDAKTRSRIFEPFFTTKEKGRGTGLGLSMVYGIVKQSDGFISVDSEPGRGTTFRIYLPQVRVGLPEAPLSHVAVETLQGTETILLVEDEEMVRTFTSDELQSLGYSILEAQSTQEAMRICREHPDPINLLLTDVVMPGLNGRELAERLVPLRPTMKILYMSGYADDAIFRDGMLDPSVAYLKKPFSIETLAQKVREALANPS